MNNQKSKDKKRYKKPQVSKYGDIEKITRSTAPPGVEDTDWGGHS